MKSETKKAEGLAHKIKALPESAMEQAEDIWCTSFNPKWQRDYFRHELDTIYGAFREDCLDAVAGLLDIKVHFGDRWIPGGGIAAVGTAPPQRGQRLIERLMTRCLRDLHAASVPISMLFPFSYPYYERMGFAITHWHEEIEISTAALARLVESGNAGNWELLPLDRCQDILPVHKKACERFNLSVGRSPLRCRQIALNPGGKQQYYLHSGGYMSWSMDRSVGEKLLITEFVYVNEEAYWDGLALIAKMGTQYETAVWFDVNHDLMFQRGMPDPKPVIKRVPWMMSRVVHLDAFEKLLPKKLGALKVFDPLGISAPTAGDISVGQLIQHVTAVWPQADKRFPPALHGIVADKPIYTSEFF
jgi:predicted acetyltransferase